MKAIARVLPFLPAVLFVSTILFMFLFAWFNVEIVTETIDSKFWDFAADWEKGFFVGTALVGALLSLFTLILKKGIAKTVWGIIILTAVLQAGFSLLKFFEWNDEFGAADVSLGIGLVLTLAVLVINILIGAIAIILPKND